MEEGSGALDAMGSPPAAQLGAELACIQCGYNLRGAAPDGRCPECGTPVQQSLRGDGLFYSDPVWVGRLRTGVTLMLWGVLVNFLLGLIGRFVPAAVSMLLTVATGLLSLASMWLVTEPEPRAWRAEQNVTLRKALRIASVISFISTLLLVAGQMSSNNAITAAGYVLALTTVPSFWLFYLHLSRLSLRLPDERLARQFRVVMWGYTISLGLTLLAGMVAIGMGLGIGVALLACPGAIGILVFAIWSIVLLVRLRSKLVLAERGAQTFHQNQPAAPDAPA